MKSINFTENIGFLRKYYDIPAKTLAHFLGIAETDYLLMENQKRPWSLYQVEKLTVLFLQPKTDFICGKVAINFDKDFYKVFSIQDLETIAQLNQVWLNQLEMEEVDNRKEKPKTYEKSKT